MSDEPGNPLPPSKILTLRGVCSGVRKDGAPCRAKARPGSQYCFGHDPALREAQVEGRQAGGRGRATSERLARALPKEMRDIQSLLSSVLEELHAGTLDPKVGGAMASVANALVRVHEAGELALRVKELEERDAGAERAS